MSKTEIKSGRATLFKERYIKEVYSYIWLAATVVKLISYWPADWIGLLDAALHYHSEFMFCRPIVYSGLFAWAYLRSHGLTPPSEIFTVKRSCKKN